MRHLTCAATILFIIGSVSFGQEPNEDDKKTVLAPSVVRVVDARSTREIPDTDEDFELSENTRSNLAIEKKLEESASFNYDETEFSEVMSDLVDKLSIDVVLDQTARDDSLAEDEPITFKVTDMPYSHALRLLLRSHNATYIIKSGVLLIISLDVEPNPEYFRLKMLDCQNLIRLLIVAEDIVPKKSVEPIVRRQVFAEINAQKLASDMLVEMVKQNVAPDEWETSNGDGRVKIYGMVMIVTQTDNVIEQTEDFLTDLEYVLRRVVRNKKS